MLNKNKKKKYLHYTDSIDDDNGTESEYEKGNIDLIINKLENKLRHRYYKSMKKQFL